MASAAKSELVVFEPTFALDINKVQFFPLEDLPGVVELYCLL